MLPAAVGSTRRQRPNAPMCFTRQSSYSRVCGHVSERCLSLLTLVIIPKPSVQDQSGFPKPLRQRMPLKSPNLTDCVFRWFTTNPSGEGFWKLWEDFLKVHENRLGSKELLTVSTTGCSKGSNLLKELNARAAHLKLLFYLSPSVYQLPASPPHHTHLYPPKAWYSYVYLHKSNHVHFYICIHVCLYVHIYIDRYMHIYMYMDIDMCKHMNTEMYRYVYVYTHLYMYKGI